LFQQTRNSGSLFLTMKKYNGQTKPKPRPKGKTKGKHASPEPEEHLCLLRASNGKKKISTIVSTREVKRFQMAYANLLKASMDGLKKRDKRTAKAAASKVKKAKATQ